MLIDDVFFVYEPTNRVSCDLAQNTGINNVDYDTGYDGYVSPYLLYAGMEGSKAHRFVFISESPIRTPYGHSTLDVPTSQWVNCELQISVSSITSGANFNILSLLTNVYKTHNEGGTYAGYANCWHLLRGEPDGTNYFQKGTSGVDFVSGQTASFHGTSNPYHLPIPRGVDGILWNQIINNGIAIRESGSSGTHLMKAYSRYSGSPPHVVVSFARSPAFLNTCQYGGDYNVDLDWCDDCDADDYINSFLIYRSYTGVVDQQIYTVSKTGGVFAHSVTLGSQPNGRRVTYKIKGRYYNSAYGLWVTSTDYGQTQAISIAIPPSNISVTPGLNQATISWTAAPAGGSQAVIYEVEYSTNGSAYSSLGTTTGTTYTDSTHDSHVVVGDRWYRVRALYYDAGVPLRSVYNTSAMAHVHSTPGFIAASNMVIDPTSDLTIYGTWTMPDGDTINKARVWIRKDSIPFFGDEDGTWVDITVLGSVWYCQIDLNPYYLAGTIVDGDILDFLVQVTDLQGQEQYYSAPVGGVFWINVKPWITFDHPVTGDGTATPTIKFTFHDDTHVNYALTPYNDYCSQFQVEICDSSYAHIRYEQSTPVADAVKDGTEVSYTLVNPLNIQTSYYYRVRASDRYGTIVPETGSETGYGNSISEWSEFLLISYPEYSNEETIEIMPPVVLSIIPAEAVFNAPNNTVSISGQYFGDIIGSSYDIMERAQYIDTAKIQSWNDTLVVTGIPYDPSVVDRVTMRDKLFPTADPDPSAPHYPNSDQEMRVTTYAGTDGDPFLVFDDEAVLTDPDGQIVTANKAVVLNGINLGDGDAYDNWTVKKQKKVKVSSTIWDHHHPEMCLDAEIVEDNSRVPIWTDNYVTFRIPEGRGEGSTEMVGHPTLSNQVEVFVYKPYSENQYCFNTFGDPVIYTLQTCPTIVMDPNPIFYWEDVCYIWADRGPDDDGAGFGDLLTDNCKIIFSVLGNPELPHSSILSWTDRVITFKFEGFSLQGFPNGVFPFGENIMVTVITPLCEGVSFTAECWKSKEERLVASSGTTTYGNYEGNDVEVEGLTIPPGGGGYSEKALRIVGGDIGFTEAGEMELITKRPKLLQDCLISILTPFGSDPWHPNFGCQYEFDIGNVFDESWTRSELQAEIYRVINYRISLQKQQMLFKQQWHSETYSDLFVYDAEMIKDLRYLDIQFDDCKINLYMKLDTELGNVLTLKTGWDTMRSIGGTTTSYNQFYGPI